MTAPTKNHGFNLPPIFEMDEDLPPFKDDPVDGVTYDKAKEIFVHNQGAISTRELRKKLHVTPDQANKIYDLLKQDIRPETIEKWKKNAK